MNAVRSLRAASLVLLASLATACVADATGDDETRASASYAVSSVQLDASAIAQTPAATIPQGTVGAAALKPQSVVGAFFGQGEALVAGAPTGSATPYDSAHVHGEVVAARGLFAFGVNESVTTAPPSLQGGLDAVVLSRSTAVLTQLGIVAQELAPGLATRRLMAQEEDGTSIKILGVERYKVFANRAINGVPVMGQRLVFTFDPNGIPTRVYGDWSALSASGHLLRPGKTTAQVVAAAGAALAKVGVSTGAAKLEWRYLPTVSQGVTTLKLVALAKVTQSGAAEPHVEVVDVGAY